MLQNEEICLNKGVSLIVSPGFSHHQLSKALFHCWRNCQPDVSGCPKIDGSDYLPKHGVVCTAPDMPSFSLSLAGTESLMFVLSDLAQCAATKLKADPA